MKKRSGIGETARSEGRNENENSDVHDRGSSQEGGESVQARHRTLAERPLRLYPGRASVSAGGARYARGDKHNIVTQRGLDGVLGREEHSKRFPTEDSEVIQGRMRVGAKSQ
jgi:hypothetical protein